MQNRTGDVGFELGAGGAAVFGVRVALDSRDDEIRAVRATITFSAFYHDKPS